MDFDSYKKQLCWLPHSDGLHLHVPKHPDWLSGTEVVAKAMMVRFWAKQNSRPTGFMQKLGVGNAYKILMQEHCIKTDTDSVYG